MCLDPGSGGYVLLYCSEDGAVCEDCRGECEESGG